MDNTIKRMRTRNLSRQLKRELKDHDHYGAEYRETSIEMRYHRLDKEGNGYWGWREISVELEEGKWALYRWWHMCPLMDDDYGREGTPTMIEEDDEVVRMVKRWLVQGLR